MWLHFATVSRQKNKFKPDRQVCSTQASAQKFFRNRGFCCASSWISGCMVTYFGMRKKTWNLDDNTAGDKFLHSTQVAPCVFFLTIAQMLPNLATCFLYIRQEQRCFNTLGKNIMLTISTDEYFDLDLITNWLGPVPTLSQRWTNQSAPVSVQKYTVFVMTHDLHNHTRAHGFVYNMYFLSQMPSSSQPLWQSIWLIYNSHLWS